MARSNKEARNIVVNDVKYRWRAKGDDGWISLSVWPEVLPGATLTCWVNYHQTWTSIGQGIWSLSRQIVITNRIVRQVIEHAIRTSGYDPHTKGSLIDLGSVDQVIDLSTAVRSA